MNRPRMLRANILKHFAQALLIRTFQHGATILRAPHKVVLETENRAGILGVLRHAENYTSCAYLFQPKKGEAAIPLPAKAGSPLAA